MKITTYDNLLEAVIKYLTDTHGIRIADITRKLGYERYDFNNYRRSHKEHTRREFMNKIIAAYPEHFSDGQFDFEAHKSPETAPPKAPPSDTSTDRLISNLERENSELRQLLKENNELMKKLLDKI
jgi:Mg2+ and Co2+ transporter CorA